MKRSPNMAFPSMAFERVGNSGGFDFTAIKKPASELKHKAGFFIQFIFRIQKFLMIAITFISVKI